MKKALLFLFTFGTFLTGFSQANKTNLIVFSEDGDKFYLVINGIRQNMKSETNIKVTDLTAENFSFTVIFEDTKIPSIKKTQSLPLGNEYTYRIKADKKGNKVLKYFGEIALEEAPKNSDAATIVYHTTEEPVNTTSTVTTNTNTSAGSNSAGNNVSVGTANSGQTTTTSTTTSTTSTTTGNGTSTGVGMNVDIKDQGNGGNVSTEVNAGGVGMNIDINVSENGASINMGGTGMNIDENATTNSNSSTGTTSTYSSTTTTTTTTTTSSGGGVSTGVNSGGNNVSVNTQVTGTGISTGTNNGSTTTVSSTNTSNSGCSYPMGTSDFDAAKKSIDSKDFEDSKFTVAKQVTKSNCLSAAQIKEVMQLFDFEATKLDYAKYAYDYCSDKNNYYKLNDAFDFESSVDELNEYLEKK